MIAITLVAAAMVIGWVNGQAGVSEGQYGQDVANNVNYLNEHFEIINVQFLAGNAINPVTGYTYCSGTPPPSVMCALQVTIYNTGNVALSVTQITVTGPGSSVTGGGQAMYVSATQTGTGAYLSSSYSSPVFGCSPSPNSQFTYTYPTTVVSGGTTETVVTTDTATTTVPIPQNTVPPAVFTVALPQGYQACPQFVVGSNYQIQVMGLYGNVVTLQATAEA